MRALLLALSLVMIAGCGPSDQEAELEQASFAVGYELGRGLASSGWQQLDQAGLWDGLEAGLAGADPEAAEQAGEVFSRLQSRFQQRLLQQSEQARLLGQQFLAQYLERPDTLQSDLGVGYRILAEGQGGYPQLHHALQVSYRLENVSGELIEEVAADTPVTLGFGQMIPAWEEALRQMRVGERRELVVPPEAGYGDLRIDPQLPPASTLYFVLQLQAVTDDQSAP